MLTNYKIVSIEGNIGSGKSTLLENLRKQYANCKHIIFLPEPVDDWEKIKDSEGNNILSLLNEVYIQTSMFLPKCYTTKVK